MFLVGSAIFGGIRGLGGAALGLTSGAFGVFVLWQLIQLVGKAAAAGGNTKTGTILTVIAFFMKLPLYVFCGMAANRLGGAAFACFLAAVVLVYSGLIAWALARPHA